MKGIILAGGLGTRLYPSTKVISKQLLNVYDKPMIYYPLSVLMLAGIKEILIISSIIDLPSYKKLLGSGSDIGIQISYKEQKNPGGLAEAFIIGEEFIDKSDVCLILGDNIFYGNNLFNLLNQAKNKCQTKSKAVIFSYKVNDPEAYGIVEIENNKIKSLEEKPKNPKSDLAIVGLYFYPNDVIKKATNIKPSKRGELEITSINHEYFLENRLEAQALGRGFSWFDTGTCESLLIASNFIHIVEKRNCLKIACLEEIALDMSFINKNDFKKIAKNYIDNDYGKYLNSIL